MAGRAWMNATMFASAVVAATALCLYLTVFHALRMHTATCFGGSFGLFGSNTLATKPFVEYQISRDVAYIFGMSEMLFAQETRYQNIEVYHHRYFGHVLVIDGSLQITERDEMYYHEMSAHVPMAYVPHAKKVLVIGGGDGGALLRLLQHPSVETAHLVDIDMHVMRDMVASYFPYLHTAYTDPRTQAFAYDGRLWVDEQLEVPEKRGSYEVVVLDSTDYGAAESLFTPAFYRKLKQLMAPRSVFVANVDSPSWNTDTVVGVQQQLGALWEHCFLFQNHQPTFLSGHYSYIFCSDAVHPMKDPVDWGAWQAKGISTYYYNEDVHYASFALPEWIRRQMYDSTQFRDLPENAFTKRAFPHEGERGAVVQEEEEDDDDDDDDVDEAKARD